MKKTIGIIITLLIAIFAMSTISNATDVGTEDDLKTQLKAEGEDTIKLTKNVEVSEGKIFIKGTKTLDLNGFTLTMKNNKCLEVNGESSNLTITGNGTITSDECSAILYAYPGGTITIENGTIRNNKAGGIAIGILGTQTDDGTKTKVTIGKQALLVGNYGIAVYQNQNNSYGVEVNVNGTIQAITINQEYTYGGLGITILGNVRATTGNVPVININEGATIIADGGPAVYAAGYGIYNIKGGKLEGTEAVSIKSGIINISGGKLVANGEYELPVANNNGTECTGSAISITNNDSYAGKVKVNITNNPVISSQNGYAILEATTSGASDKVESIDVKGGDFSGGKGSIAIGNTEKLRKIVEGGTFNSDITEYMKDGLTEVVENGVHYVGKANDIVISESENGKVVISGTSAIKGQSIKINVMSDEGYELDNVTVLDEDGKTVEVSDLQFVMPDSKVTVKATFKAKVGEEETKPETPAESTKPTEPEETPNEGEKDDTPKTGSTDVVIYISVAVAVLAFTGIKFVKRKEK